MLAPPTSLLASRSLSATGSSFTFLNLKTQIQDPHLPAILPLGQVDHSQKLLLKCQKTYSFSIATTVILSDAATSCVAQNN